MIKLRTVTIYILICIAMFMATYDIIPFINAERGDTISEVIAGWGLKLFSLPLIFGVLSGHFFFLRDNSRPQPKVLIPTGAIIIAIDVVTHIYNIGVLENLQRHPAIWFILGIPFGMVFWPQTKQDKLK